MRKFLRTSLMVFLRAFSVIVALLAIISMVAANGLAGNGSQKDLAINNSFQAAKHYVESKKNTSHRLPTTAEFEIWKGETFNQNMNFILRSEMPPVVEEEFGPAPLDGYAFSMLRMYRLQDPDMAYAVSWKNETTVHAPPLIAYFLTWIVAAVVLAGSVMAWIRSGNLRADPVPRHRGGNDPKHKEPS